MKIFLDGLLSPSGNRFLMGILMATVCFTGCRKEPGFRNDLPASQFPADVIDKWMTLEVRIYKTRRVWPMEPSRGPLRIQASAPMNPLIPDRPPEE